jgi:hypothetical protein
MDSRLCRIGLRGKTPAVALLSGFDGRRDLVVLMVDNPPGKNRGLYRVGKTLDATGIPTAGWGPWIAYRTGFHSRIREQASLCGI